MTYQPSPYNNSLDLNELLNVGDCDSDKNGEFLLKTSSLDIVVNAFSLSFQTKLLATYQIIFVVVVLYLNISALKCYFLYTYTYNFPNLKWMKNVTKLFGTMKKLHPFLSC